MALEIERRFLVLPEALPRPWPRGERFTQGYLGFTPTVRVRLVQPAGGGAAHAFLTLKGRGAGRTRRVRQEYEYAIPPADARALLALCGTHVLEKVRAHFGPWVLDRYLGRFRGLWLAEFEMTRADDPLPRPRPPWLGREVTADPRYTNAVLARLSAWPPWLGK